MVSNHWGLSWVHVTYFQGGRCPCIVNKYEYLSLVDKSSFLYVRFPLLFSVSLQGEMVLHYNVGGFVGGK